MAETALVLPLMVVLVFSIIDLASITSAYVALQNGVTQATRYGVTGRVMAGHSREQSILAILRRSTPSFTINDEDVSFYNVSQRSGGTGGPSDIIRVSVTHDWRLMSPALKPLFTNGVAKIQVSSTMANEPFPTATP
jgi:hypothetical protein